MKESLANGDRDWKKTLEELKLATDQAVELGGDGGQNSLYNQVAELANIEAPNVAQRAVETTEKISQEVYNLEAKVPEAFSQTGEQLTRDSKMAKADLKSQFRSLTDHVEK